MLRNLSSPPPIGGGRNAERNFRGEKRSNQARGKEVQQIAAELRTESGDIIAAKKATQSHPSKASHLAAAWEARKSLTAWGMKLAVLKACGKASSKVVAR